MIEAPLVLAIDQGTTNTKAALVDPVGRIHARSSAPLVTAYPRPGWVEQSAQDIWESVRKVVADLAQHAGEIVALAIANQRETLVMWDAENGEPVAPAIIWQCRRTADDCAHLQSQGHDARVVELTGLGINPLFPASKLGWAIRNLPDAAALAGQGRLRAGTVDAWLLYKLTGGASFLTDHSNASRSQLFDTDKLDWSAELCALFGAPLSALPRPVASDAEFGVTVEGATALPAGLPIRAMMGDSHAALYGHGVRAPGPVKATFGTGSSLMTLTPDRMASGHGLSGTIAWSDRNGVAHALEGNITVSAQASAFMAQMLGMKDARALSDLAQSVPDAGGVVFVPALAGLGAPHWDDRATGLVTGMTHATRPAHLARATFEAIAHQITDVFEAMELDIGHPLADLRADGGASVNAFLLQLQADLLDRPVLRSEVEEVGALGAAAMAFSALGFPAVECVEGTTGFQPQMPGETRRNLRTNWARGVAMARG